MKRNPYLGIIALVVTFLAIAISGYSQIRPQSPISFSVGEQDNFTDYR